MFRNYIVILLLSFNYFKLSISSNNVCGFFVFILGLNSISSHVNSISSHMTRNKILPKQIWRGIRTTEPGSIPRLHNQTICKQSVSRYGIKSKKSAESLKEGNRISATILRPNTKLLTWRTLAMNGYMTSCVPIDKWIQK